MGSEATAIAAVGEPATVRSLTDQLQSLGVSAGDVVIAHCSLSALGWVVGGAQAVVEALEAVVGVAGTLVMPTQSGQLSDPVRWSNPPVPPAWVETIRAELPAYDPHRTATRGMGQIVDCFRSHPEVRRSAHPTVSFAARGPAADQIVGAHPLTPAFGETSPLARLYELDAKVLLIGVGHDNNTSLHLAENRADWPGKPSYREGVPVLVDGERRWVNYDDVYPNDEDFDDIGAAFAATGAVRTGRLGAGFGRLCQQRGLVDFAVAWMAANRNAIP